MCRCREGGLEFAPHLEHNMPWTEKKRLNAYPDVLLRPLSPWHQMQWVSISRFMYTL